MQIELTATDRGPVNWISLLNGQGWFGRERAGFVNRQNYMTPLIHEFDLAVTPGFRTHLIPAENLQCALGIGSDYRKVATPHDPYRVTVGRGSNRKFVEDPKLRRSLDQPEPSFGNNEFDEMAMYACTFQNFLKIGSGYLYIGRYR